MKIYEIDRERLEEIGKEKTYREIAEMFEGKVHPLRARSDKYYRLT